MFCDRRHAWLLIQSRLDDVIKAPNANWEYYANFLFCQNYMYLIKKKLNKKKKKKRRGRKRGMAVRGGGGQKIQSRLTVLLTSVGRASD